MRVSTPNMSCTLQPGDSRPTDDELYVNVRYLRLVEDSRVRSSSCICLELQRLLFSITIVEIPLDLDGNLDFFLNLPTISLTKIFPLK